MIIKTKFEMDQEVWRLFKFRFGGNCPWMVSSFIIKEIRYVKSHSQNDFGKISIKYVGKNSTDWDYEQNLFTSLEKARHRMIELNAKMEPQHANNK